MRNLFHNARFVCGFMLGFLATSFAFAADAEPTSYLIKAKHVFTMNGETLSPGMVLVRDGKIAEVAAEISADAGIETIEVNSLMPGMVNAQSTAGLVESGGETSREVTPEFETVGMIDFDSRDFREALDGGETTIHVMPSTDNVIAGWTCIVKTAGGDDRVLASRKGVALSMCSDPAGRNRSRTRPDSIYVRQPTNRMGVVWIMRNQLGRAQRVSEEATGDATKPLEQVLDGVVPAYGVSRTGFDIQSLLTVSDEFGFRPVVVGGHEAYDVIDELVNADVSVVYTAVDRRAIGTEGTELFWATPMRLREAGINYCIAGDGLLERMRYAVRFGLTPDQAMAGVTVDAASLMGLSDRVGKIAVGYDADLLGFSGQPTEMTSALRWVMVNGKQVGTEN
ncbi:MAG: amidohydrolase family protein [Planctomycetota bacterium]